MGEHSYRADNARELSRMRRLVDGLDAADLERRVNADWTVAGVLGHIAFWDGRALVLARKLAAGEALTAADEEPDDIDWVNDASAAFLHAVSPVEAARAALRVAEDTDAAVAGLEADVAATQWPLSETGVLNLVRAEHRGEHLDEIEAALGR